MPSKKEQKWRRGIKHNDSNLNLLSGKETDIIILVMGPTGSGKSTLINAYLGTNEMEVADGFDSNPRGIQYKIIDLPNSERNNNDSPRRLILVDTPGFDDTMRDDVEVLGNISVWLAESYSSSMKVAGIVYLQDITQTRMLRGLMKSQKVFENLCGKKSMSSVTLVTTKWGISFSEHEKFRRREDELKEKYWKDMIASGAKVVRFKSEDKAEAEGIFHRIVLEYHQSAKLRIQKEMVDRNRRLPETKAAAILREDLREEITRRKEALTQALREENKFLQDQLDELPEGFASRFRRALFGNN